MDSSSSRLRGRTVFLCALSILIGLAMAVIAQALLSLIILITNVAFYGRLNVQFASPAGSHLGILMILVPIIGGLIVGAMARYGSPAIRGHGIPEAMEQILLNQSNIPPRLLILKPVSAAIAIGTGGPFGAEGPIIATGGAFGSLIGQLFRTTPLERKILLSAGAAAGMSATFGCPISAVLLAVELLLFEFHARSIIPVAAASVAAAALRLVLIGSGPMFAIPDLAAPTFAACGCYCVFGLIMGATAVAVTKVVYASETAFEKLPIHWMWWPALGAIAVGIIGFMEPRTLGVGYENISDLLSARLAGADSARLGLLKFASWTASLSSGTSGGTLAPLMTIGAAIGAILAKFWALLFPASSVDVRMAALVGMASLFAGASGAFLASVVFAIETTLQPHAIIPLLGGCAAAYLISRLMMDNTLMTEKIARRGVRVPAGYTLDTLHQVSVLSAASRPPICLRADQSVRDARSFLTSGRPEAAHKGFPVVDAEGLLVGFSHRRELLDGQVKEEACVGEICEPAESITENASLREALQLMLKASVGRLPVISRSQLGKVIGILTRTDIILAYQRDEDAGKAETVLILKNRAKNAAS